MATKRKTQKVEKIRRKDVRPKAVVTAAALARVLGVSRTTVWNWIRSGSLPAGRGRNSPKCHYQIPVDVIRERWGQSVAQACGGR